MPDITIYQARNILTMNPRRPAASHVAVRDGLVLGTGSLEDLSGWGAYVLDERFADKVLMPGMIEGHSHAQEGSVWQDAYVGSYARRGPDGTVWPALESIDAVVARLQAAEEELPDATSPLMAWGFDPIYFKNRRMTIQDLDQVSTSRPVIITHASFHIVNVNSAVLKLAKISRDTDVMGIVKDDKGEPTGELQGVPARFLVHQAVGQSPFDDMAKPESLWRFARSAQLSGVTTATDLANQMTGDSMETYSVVTADDAYPLRIVPAFIGNASPAAEGVTKLKGLIALSHTKLRIGLVKLVADGSIQGFTARLKAPGYYNGSPNGLWYIEPDQIQQIIETYHAAGLQIHLHTNGDQATEVVLDAIEETLRRAPHADPRFTLQHCQMAHEAHYRRMARLGVSANLFSNHIFYWGDEHYDLTMGPERAERMNATATATRLGVPFAIHSDAPVTPLSPLFTAWCAVNRQTRTGRVLGEAEKLTVAQALYATTMGAAYTLKLDQELGSIETGKRADFAVLEENPLELDPAALKDIEVWGTVLGGRVFANSEITS